MYFLCSVFSLRVSSICLQKSFFSPILHCNWILTWKCGNMAVTMKEEIGEYVLYQRLTMWLFVHLMDAMSSLFQITGPFLFGFPLLLNKCGVNLFLCCIISLTLLNLINIRCYFKSCSSLLVCHHSDPNWTVSTHLLSDISPFYTARSVRARFASVAPPRRYSRSKLFCPWDGFGGSAKSTVRLKAERSEKAVTFCEWQSCVPQPGDLKVASSS